VEFLGVFSFFLQNNRSEGIYVVEAWIFVFFNNLLVIVENLKISRCFPNEPQKPCSCFSQYNTQKTEWVTITQLWVDFGTFKIVLRFIYPGGLQQYLPWWYVSDIAMRWRWMMWNVPYDLVTVIFYFYKNCLWCWMYVGFQAHQNSLIPWFIF
jgi:hypothetical protein